MSPLNAIVQKLIGCWRAPFRRLDFGGEEGGRRGKEREKRETARSEIKGHGIEIKGRGGKGT